MALPPIVIGPYIQEIAGNLATWYTNALKDFIISGGGGLGVQINYISRAGVTYTLWAMPLPSEGGEVSVIEVDTDVTVKSWKIPKQDDGLGGTWPHDGEPCSEEKIVDGKGDTWWVREGQGAVRDLDSLGVLFNITTERRHAYRVK